MLPAQPTIKQGSAGVAVKRCQALLNVYGGTPLTVDGQFGPKTDERARNFQRSRGLTVDGIVGPQTWRELMEDT